MSRPAKLLLVEFFSRGGLFHYAAQLGAGLAAQGADVTLLTGREPETAALPAGLALDASLRTWNPHRRPRGVPRRLVRAGRGARYVYAWAQIVAAARRLAPDAVLLGDFEHRCDLWGVTALRRLHCRLGAIWHNVEAFDRWGGPGLTRTPAWRNALARRFDAVFVHGAALAARLRELSGVTAHVIPHGNQAWIARLAAPEPCPGAGLDARLRLPPGRPLALLFGALTRYKGAGVLLEALRRLPAAERPFALIAGQPAADFAPPAAPGLDRDVAWDLRYIPTPEIAWYFRRADFVVLPYPAASQSGVAHLALTFGKPLIVTRAGALPDLIAGNGRVVEANDAGSLAAALAELTRNAPLRAEMAARSLELARTRHDWERIAGMVLPHLLRD